MEMKSRAVKLFCAIAESGSLLAASNKLNLSSSAASRMLSQLEDRLGVKLFERGNKQALQRRDSPRDHQGTQTS